MSQERVIAQVKPRLQRCLEQRDRPAILALTAWLVHRHGHPLLQHLLSQPEWSSHRPWWGEQIHHPPQPPAGLPLDGHPESRTESSPPARDDVKLTPAQVTKQRLKRDKAAKSVPMQGSGGEIPTVPQVTGKERSPKGSPDRQHRSLRLRDWLPSRHLPHQCPRQDAA